MIFLNEFYLAILFHFLALNFIFADDVRAWSSDLLSNFNLKFRKLHFLFNAVLCVQACPRELIKIIFNVIIWRRADILLLLLYDLGFYMFLDWLNWYSWKPELISLLLINPFSLNIITIYFTFILDLMFTNIGFLKLNDCIFLDFSALNDEFSDIIRAATSNLLTEVCFKFLECHLMPVSELSIFTNPLSTLSLSIFFITFRGRWNLMLRFLYNLLKHLFLLFNYLGYIEITRLSVWKIPSSWDIIFLKNDSTSVLNNASIMRVSFFECYVSSIFADFSSRYFEFSNAVKALSFNSFSKNSFEFLECHFMLLSTLHIITFPSLSVMFMIGPWWRRGPLILFLLLIL